MFKYTKRLIAEIRFRLDEQKWDAKEEEEIAKVEGFSGHGSMDEFRIHKIFESQRAERKRLHKEALAAIK